MALDDLPSALVVPLRDSERDRYLRDVRLRNPGANTSEGTLEYADASVFADMMMPVYYDAKTMGDYVANVNKSGPAVDLELQNAGTSRLPEVGGSGYVGITASTGGGTIFQGDEIKDTKTGFRYQCIATALYANGQYVPIQGIDTGPTTNLDALTVMTWTFPRPGISPTAIVIEQVDGTGLSGGRNAETDQQAIDRLKNQRATPPASGNDADYQTAIQKTPGLIIQQGFTYPDIRGASSTAITATLRPGTPGGNRIPNPTQMAQIAAYVKGKFAATDNVYMTTLIASPVELWFDIDWAPGAAGWADLAPWPPESTLLTQLFRVDTAVVPTTTTFRLSSFSLTTPPQIGQTIAFYDQPNGTFRRKRILSFTTVNTNTFDIVCDTFNGTSDLTYVPYVGQAPGPWSDSLTSIISDVVEFFDTLGPGEQLDPLPDPNLKMRRSPRSPSVAASIVTNRIVKSLFDLAQINDITLKSPSVPYATPVGSPGFVSYLLTLGSIVCFPES